MLATLIISLIVILILFFVYREYRNEKKYQETRKEKRRAPKSPVSTPSVKCTSTHPTPKPKPVIKKKVQKPKVAEVPKTDVTKNDVKKTEIQKEEKREKVEQRPVVPQSKPETSKADKTETILELPKCQYPAFSHERLVGMGFSEAEAKEYVVELIAQIETETPLLKESIANSDFEKVEHITHSIKGSSSTIGNGGISDLIGEFNLYVQTGKEKKIAETYFKYMQKYYEELKAQYKI